MTQVMYVVGSIVRPYRLFPPLRNATNWMKLSKKINKIGRSLKSLAAITVLVSIPACSSGVANSPSKPPPVPKEIASIQRSDTKALLGNWQYFRDDGNNDEQARRKTSALIPPPRAWEIHFYPDHFEEVIDENFRIAAQYRGNYSFVDGVLTLRETWRPKGHEVNVKVTASGDRLTMWDPLLAWTIEFHRSDKPNQYLQSLPRIPHTVDEAVLVIKTNFREEDLRRIRNMKEEDLINLHLGLGMYIRNGFDLWRGNSELMKACGAEHPDEASGVIIQALWKSLRAEN